MERLVNGHSGLDTGLGVEVVFPAERDTVLFVKPVGIKSGLESDVVLPVFAHLLLSLIFSLDVDFGGYSNEHQCNVCATGLTSATVRPETR
jgi:hypothetical protein